MTLEEIKSAVEAGKTVHWINLDYQVIKDSIGQWLIKCFSTGHCWGLTHTDGITMNEPAEEFFVADWGAALTSVADDQKRKREEKDKAFKEMLNTLHHILLQAYIDKVENPSIQRARDAVAKARAVMSDEQIGGGL